MVKRTKDYDEDDIRVRANPRGSRPRTRQRPVHEDAADAMVIAVDRGRYTCLLELDPAQRAKQNRRGKPAERRQVTAMKARELGRKGVVVGDRVGLVGDLQGGPDALARVVRVHPRQRVLRRTADDTDPVERIIVANADQLVIVTALADPEPRPRMIDRCLVAAFEAGLTPVLCLTKSDLADPAELLASYLPLGITAISTRARGGARTTGPAPGVNESAGDGLDELREILAGKVSVLVGHSGVGKSTLVNALVPAAERAVGQVNDVTGRGRHTSTSAVALRLPPIEVPGDGRGEASGGGAPLDHDPELDLDLDESGSAPGSRRGPSPEISPAADPESAPTPRVLPEGWVIDTPGIRSFGLAHIGPNGVIAAFPDLAAVTAECPRGCTHAADAPDCALDPWLASLGTETSEEAVARFASVSARVDSVRRLLSALNPQAPGAHAD